MLRGDARHLGLDLARRGQHVRPRLRLPIGGEAGFGEDVLVVPEPSGVGAVRDAISLPRPSPRPSPCLQAGSTRPPGARYLSSSSGGAGLDVGVDQERPRRPRPRVVRRPQQAEETSDRWFNGTKTFITQGSVGPIYVVLASTAPEKKAKGLTAFIIERGTPGFRTGKQNRKDGPARLGHHRAGVGGRRAARRAAPGRDRPRGSSTR